MIHLTLHQAIVSLEKNEISESLGPSLGLSSYTTMIGEGNGNPLQYSCLENPVDKGAW